jgi:hypothetical protein
VRRDGLAPSVQTEDLRSTTRRDEQSQQEPYHRRLARPVGTEATNDLAFVDLKIESLKRAGLTELFGQVEGRDGWRAHENSMFFIRIGLPSTERLLSTKLPLS